MIYKNNKERKTIIDDCGSVTIIASSNLVSITIRPNKGWLFWSFTGDVDDTLGNDHHFYLYSTGSTSLNESYELWTRGHRTLTLSGEAVDISGNSCVVSREAFITHYW